MPPKLEEMLGLKKIELTGDRKILVEKLRALMMMNGEARLIKQIVARLEYGLDEDAKRLCWTDSDKFRVNPEAREILRQYLFGEKEDAPWGARAATLGKN
jgi:hypothetical protein